MKQNILLLTKSKKFKGYCVTGINIENGEWVRFNPDGEESYPIKDFVFQDGSIPELLDIIGIDVAYSCGTYNQPENVTITNHLERSTANPDVNLLLEKRAKEDFIKHKKLFYNSSFKIDCDSYSVPDGEEPYSLHLIKPETVIIYKIDQTKCRASIKYNNEIYESLRITDLDFIDQIADLEIGKKYKITGDVYIVVSLAEKFFDINNERWESYKLISSIIRVSDVEKRVGSNAQQHLNTSSINRYSTNKNSVINNEILLRTSIIPGEAEFFNYNELRTFLQEQLQPYNDTKYSIDNINVAKEDYEVLKQVRRKLSSKKKELEREYTKPINKVIEQIDELIALVKQPYDVIDKLLKTNKKQIKEREIMLYAGRKASILGEYAENVLESPAFFNPRWKNISYKDRDWKKDVDDIIDSAMNTIDRILNGEEHNINAKLAFFFEKLTLQGYESFEKVMDKNSYIKQPVSIESNESRNKTEDCLHDNNVKCDTNKPADSIIEKRIVLKGQREDIERYLDLAKKYDVEYIDY